MLEQKIEKYFVSSCERIGLPTEKLVLQGRRGFPDRTVLLPGGSPIFVEFKRSGGRLSEPQKFWQARLLDLGYEYHQIWSMDQAKALVKTITERMEGT